MKKKLQELSNTNFEEVILKQNIVDYRGMERNNSWGLW